MAGGGFDHNAQSLRVVTELEKKYASFDGLNLTFETLEGMVKHNGPLLGHGVSKPVPERSSLTVRSRISKSRHLRLRRSPGSPRSPTTSPITATMLMTATGPRSSPLPISPRCRLPHALWRRYAAFIPASTARGSSTRPTGADQATTFRCRHGRNRAAAGRALSACHRRRAPGRECCRRLLPSDAARARLAARLPHRARLPRPAHRPHHERCREGGG